MYLKFRQQRRRDIPNRFYHMTFTILINKQDLVITSLNIRNIGQGFKAMGNVVTYKKFQESFTSSRGNFASKTPHGYVGLFERNKSNRL